MNKGNYQKFRMLINHQGNADIEGIVERVKGRIIDRKSRDADSIVYFPGAESEAREILARYLANSPVFESSECLYADVKEHLRKLAQNYNQSTGKSEFDSWLDALNSFSGSVYSEALKE